MDVEDELGFTLVELLVVIMLMGILGAITTAGIASAMKTTRQDQARVQNSTMMETQLQRMSRDLRVADPLRAVSTSSVVFDIFRGTGCRRLEYRMSGTDLQIRTQTWTSSAACNSYPAATTANSDTGYVAVMGSISSATPFSFLDHSGAVLASPTVGTTKQVVVTLTQTQTENRAPLTMSSTVALRNVL